MTISLLGIYNNLIKEGSKEELTADEIATYIYDITPNKDDTPDYYIDQIKKSKKLFKLQRLNIVDLMKKDPSLSEYIESEEDRYGEDEYNDYEPSYDELLQPIVVFNGEVVDGYNRTAVHYYNGEEFINGYVSK